MKKPIKNFEGLYEIHENGTVISLERISADGRKLKQQVKKTSFGTRYPSVTLCKNGKMFMFHLHRLLAEHFIPNPNNYPQINHKDGDKHNYALDNLEWCTQSQNCKHSHDHLPRKKNYKQPNRSKEVDMLLKDGTYVCTFESVTEAEFQTGFSHISCVCLGKRKSAGGFVFQFRKPLKSAIT